jgi:hypothetical protein
MKDTLTFRFPRTMQEAFGPYARLTVEDEAVQLCEGDELIVATCAVALVALAIIIAVWG